ncbi:MAG: sensor histidine kinase, partial [Ignavibacteriaceae bacterium]|nr:sensor histidine kinase [Ignavibacteriaceae bacterium]
VEAASVKTDLQIDSLNLNADQAVYIGLIVNELVSNSLKHAFKLKEYNDGKFEKWIRIDVQKELNGGHCIKISDNGCGFPDHINFKNTDSLGLQLVISLVKQLDGEISLDKSSGTVFTIKF